MVQAPACPVCAGTGAPLFVGVEDYFFGSHGQWDIWRCAAPHCGCAWIDPPPDDATLARAYSVYYTHAAPPVPAHEVMLGKLAVAWAARFGSRFPLIPFLFREFENQMLDSGGIKPQGGIVLDVGCGAGERLDYFKALGWGAAIGIDSDPVAAERARALGRDVRHGGAERLPVADGTADAVFMHHLLEHVQRPLEIIEQARRVLKPGGRIVITTPNAESVGVHRHKEKWRGFEAPRHLQIFTLAALGNLLADGGFVVTTARTSARARPFMDAASLSVASAHGDGASRPRGFWRQLGKILVDDGKVLSTERQIRRGENVGEELFVVAEKAIGS